MNVFTYGSLMFPEVWLRVAAVSLPSQSATLLDYAAWKVRGQTYPALTPALGQTTQGIVYVGVEPEAAQRLDTFEGPFYTRSTVSVQLVDGSTLEAEVYLVTEAFRDSLLDERWDAEAFRVEHLSSFLGPKGAW